MAQLAQIDVLLPTYNRLESLIVTLAGVAAQSFSDLHVVVADQSEEPVGERPVIQALRRIIEARGGTVEWHPRPQIHGIAEQRDFLLGRATAEAVLYLDDDVLMEPWVIELLAATLRAQQCGFVGAFPVGLTYREDVRPTQQNIEFWDGPVQPEILLPGSAQWERWQLHRAANIYHIAQRLEPGEHRLYKVAWVASCVLYDRAKIAGGRWLLILAPLTTLSFWRRSAGAELTHASLGWLLPLAIRHLLYRSAINRPQ